MCSWLLSFQRRLKVGVYLGDISGAFDRVDAKRFLHKLRRRGVCDKLLAPRLARVAVDGAFSMEFVLQNMVFQGTVLGPSLWNVYFADVHVPAEKNGARERRFAHDLSASKAFSRTVSNEDVISDLQKNPKRHPRLGRKQSRNFRSAERRICSSRYTGRRCSTIPSPRSNYR